MTGAKSFACGLSTARDWRRAAREACAQARAGLQGPCDLLLAFVVEMYPDLDPAALPALLAEELPHKLLLGCNASGVLAGGREVEMEPAVSVMAMSLPGARLVPWDLAPGELARLDGPGGLLKSLDLYPSERPKFLALADPMSCDVERLLELFNEAYPGSPVMGGLASGPALRKRAWLLSGAECLREGAAGVALTGEVSLETAVAQGCRPIGTRFVITKTQENALLALGGRPPLEVLRETVLSLPPRDRELARHSLFAGIAMAETRTRFEQGDFLVRNIIGADEGSGALVIGAPLRAGQSLQFHLRDADASRGDLERTLDAMAGPRGEGGALLFSCCGRGKGLYGEEGHDSALIQERRGPLPLAGFFANGEFGPVGGRNFIHGYTSSLAVIR